jgi:hypothetical protein
MMESDNDVTMNKTALMVAVFDSSLADPAVAEEPDKVYANKE